MPVFWIGLQYDGDQDINLPSFKISIFDFFIVCASASLGLALAQCNFIVICICILVFASLSFFCFSHELWRHIVYGGVIGGLLGFCVLLTYFLLNYNSVFRGPVGYVWVDIIIASRNYILSCGFALGASLGFVFYRATKPPKGQAKN